MISNKSCRPRWSDEEINILINNYTIKSKQELIKILPLRKWPSIIAKANSLNLYQSYQNLNVLDRFYKYVNKNSAIYGRNNCMETECWIWTGSVSAKYGEFKVNKKRYKSHRFAYEIKNGPIPNKMTVHHKCYITTCVNPDHLELKTLSDNILDDSIQNLNFCYFNAKKTHCPYGHEFKGDNLIRLYNGKRRCKTCYNKYQKKYRGSHK